MIDCAFEFRVLYIRLFVQLFLNNVVPFGLNDKIVFHSNPKQPISKRNEDSPSIVILQKG